MDDKKKEKWCYSPLAIRPLLYTDTLRGYQTLRDDLWAVSTDELNTLHAKMQALELAAQLSRKQAAPAVPGGLKQAFTLARNLHGRHSADLADGYYEAMNKVFSFVESVLAAAPAAPTPTAQPEQIEGIDVKRLLRNLKETSYNEGSEALACRLSDCQTVIKSLLKIED